MQVVIAGTADGAVAIVERDQEGTLKRGRTFRLPQVLPQAQLQTPCYCPRLLLMSPAET